MRNLLVIGMLFYSITSFAFSLKITLPDPTLTSGSYCTPSDPDFREYRYAEQIPWCARNVDSETKLLIYSDYGIEPSHEYTIDHLIPLALGGSNHVDNLWPQHESVYSGRLEYELYLRLKRGEITQQEAVNKILSFKFSNERTL
jgi:hypothetical protein